MTLTAPRSLSDPRLGSLALIRAEGTIRAAFSARGRATAIARLYESGGYRLKFPKGAACEAVIVNTGGGMAGGDHVTLDLDVGDHANVTVTTQSAEKLYRAEDEISNIGLHLRVGPGGCLSWLPQEMIMFSGARLSRSLTLDVDAHASVLLYDSLVFGRIAMGERVNGGLFRDRWRIRRHNKLIFAEDTRLDQTIADTLDHKAVGAGARALATCVYIAPDAETRLAEARQILLNASCDCAASAWNGMMVVRFLAHDPQDLRRSAANFLLRFRNTALPRVWQC